MNKIIGMTLGGLSQQYYIRNILFGLMFPVILIAPAMQDGHAIKSGIILISIVNTLLYPYSRFIYEKIIGFIVGENKFWVNAIFMLIVKFITMAFCWSFAIFVAPIGLLYLYLHNRKTVS